MRAWEYADRPIVLSHRGGALEFPENSLSAFQAMNDMGLRYVETDVHPSKDGKLVIMHDPLLNRTTDGSGFVSSYTWDEIREFVDGSGRRPVLLEEVLETFPEMTFNVDIKSDDGVGPAVSLLSSGGYHDRVLLASFSEARLRRLRTALPGINTSLGISAIAKLVAASHASRPLRRQLLSGVPGPSQGVVCVQVPMIFKRTPVMSENFVDVAAGHGLDVHVWTLNEALDMSTALDMGARGIITDRPSLAVELISARMDTRNREK